MIRITFIFVFSLLCSQLALGQKQHFVDFWEGGIKKSEGFYERGYEHGSWKYYHQTGELQEEANYFYGKLHGAVVKYHVNGQRMHEGKWVLGLQDSLMQSWSAEGILLPPLLYGSKESLTVSR